MVAHRIRAFEYAIGDEVVVLLAGVRAFDLAAGLERCGALPAWTIGEVVARIEQEDRHAYTARFLLDDALCIALVEEGAIEGLA